MPIRSDDVPDAVYAATVLRMAASAFPGLESEGDWEALAVEMGRRLGLRAAVDLVAWARQAGVARDASPVESLAIELGRLHQQRIAGRRKATGAFYTPPAVIAEVVAAGRAALGPHHAPRVLDPSCGTGAFLLEVHRQDRRARVYGIDSDAEAVRLAHLASRAKGVPAHVVAGDFLECESPGDPQFDLIVGNPPYVRYHALAAELAARLRNQFKSAQGQFDLFAPMIEQSLAHLRPGGVLAFVLPSLFLRGPRYVALRRVMLDRAHVVSVTEHGDGVFAGVQAPTCHVVLKKRGGVVPLHVRYAQPAGEVLVREATWRADPAVLFAAIDSEGARWLDVLEQGVALGTAARVRRGYPAGRSHAAWSERDDSVQCVAGEDVQPYRLRRVRRLSPTLGGWPEALGRSAGERVLVRETGARLVAAVAPDGVHITRTVYAVWPEQMNPWALCGILNSEVAQRWYQLKCRAVTGIFPKLRIGQLRSFPLPFLDDRSEGVLAELARRKAEGLSVDDEIETLVRSAYGLDVDI